MAEETEPTLEPTLTYEEKIQELLNRVTNGETIYEKEEDDTIKKSIKENGVKGSIMRVFSESYGDYTLNEETEESTRIGDSNFFKVDIPSSSPHADDYWESLVPLLRSIGDATIDPAGSSRHLLGNTGEGNEDLQMELVRNEDANDKPSIYLQWNDTEDLTEDQAKSILEKAGIGVENMYKVGKGVVAEAIN